ncbi:MAG TPA: tRNA (adenosine(37)-N6)-dimethylallyltransferase MiaA [Candidatus Moranbacteria bacterium]|nr:tRNA (adenosine(37)-N6)-dimethylallyltransferase MiaA [Candidatus Moranbacteria bacterium]
MPKSNKIIVILGPTASGKSEIAIKLAKKFNGEIISADSRQIYKHMEINTGAVPLERKENKGSTLAFSQNIPHYLISFLEPDKKYNVVNFKEAAQKIISDILKRKKLPIICGGTGFWIKALIDDITFPEVKPNWKLRKKLASESAPTLFAQLQKKDPRRAASIDAKNKVRLIRALEICQKLGKVPLLKKVPLNNLAKTTSSLVAKYSFLQIGIQQKKENLNQKIKLNVQEKFKNGMIEEVKKLHSVSNEKPLSWKKIQSFGLSFNLIPQYLSGKINSKKELLEKIYQAEKNYAKRQMTWFKKDSRIKWLENYTEIEKTVNQFLSSKK